MCFRKSKKNIPNKKVVVQPAAEPTIKVASKKKDVNIQRYTGKYEVFPEAGLFKYRLKASNGEILIVSAGYKTRSGAKSGIETFKKNVVSGNFELVTDKNGYSQFRLYSSNGARLIANGEYYDSMSGATSALESTKKFALTDKYIDLKDLPKEEIREELVKLGPVEKMNNGKIEVYLDDKYWKAALKAANGQILFVTNGYASKSGLLKGIENIQDEIDRNTFRVSCDKLNRYQFKLYSSNNQQLLVGETYSNKNDAFSAIDSVRRISANAEIIEL